MLENEGITIMHIMFWTILAIMLVMLYSLKLVIVTQKHIENMDKNIEKLVKKTLAEEERILKDLEGKKKL